LSIDFLEVGCYLSSHQEVIEVFLLTSFLEGEDSLDNDEQNDAHGEQVHLSTVIGLALLDFGSHVGHCTSVRLEVINALVARKPEIGDLQIEVIINKNVFQLQVTMHASEVMHIFDSVNHLVHEEAPIVFSHCSHSLAEVKEEASLDILHDDEYQVGDNTA